MKEIEKYLPCEQKKEVNVGKIIFKTATIYTSIVQLVHNFIECNIQSHTFQAFSSFSFIYFQIFLMLYFR